MDTTRSILSILTIFFTDPGWSTLIPQCMATCLYKVSITRELLPEPETPVTQVKTPNGMVQSIFLILLVVTPFKVKNSSGSRRSSGIGTFKSPRIYFAVSEWEFLKSSCTFPENTSSPPCSPEPGPSSKIVSASRIVASSCSTTKTVLPRFCRLRKVWISRSLSRGCKPMEGSSST